VLLHVVPASAAQLAALVEGEEVFAARFGRAVATGFNAFSDAAERGLEGWWNGDVVPPWWTHLFFLPGGPLASAELVGIGGYHGAPDADGEVEIDCAIAPARRGRGYATQAVRELVRRAFVDGAARSVVAHTGAAYGAPARILEYCGFERVFSFYDPSKGSRWRWQARRADAAAPAWPIERRWLPTRPQPEHQPVRE
jgi:RimJ/RimL family protein N-acetyltransferase